MLPKSKGVCCPLFCTSFCRCAGVGTRTGHRGRRRTTSQHHAGTLGSCHSAWMAPPTRAAEPAIGVPRPVEETRSRCFMPEAGVRSTQDRSDNKSQRILGAVEAETPRSTDHLLSPGSKEPKWLGPSVGRDGGRGPGVEGDGKCGMGDGGAAYRTHVVDGHLHISPAPRTPSTPLCFPPPLSSRSRHHTGPQTSRPRSHQTTAHPSLPR